MTNCKCGNPLREGESECDECYVRQRIPRMGVCRLITGVVYTSIPVVDVAHTLRETEGEKSLAVKRKKKCKCDWCLLERYDFDTSATFHARNKVIQALRRGEKEPTNDD